MNTAIWALILVLQPGTALTSINGFSSEESCQAAFETFVTEYRKEFRGVKPRGYCVKVE